MKKFIISHRKKLETCKLESTRFFFFFFLSFFKCNKREYDRVSVYVCLCMCAFLEKKKRREKECYTLQVYMYVYKLKYEEQREFIISFGRVEKDLTNKYSETIDKSINLSISAECLLATISFNTDFNAAGTSSCSPLRISERNVHNIGEIN